MTVPTIRVNRDNTQVAVRHAPGRWVIVSTPIGFVRIGSDAHVDGWRHVWPTLSHPVDATRSR